MNMNMNMNGGGGSEMEMEMEKETKESSHIRRNPLLIRAYMEIYDRLSSMKAHLEKGLFRIPGEKKKVAEYCNRIKHVGNAIINIIIININILGRLCLYS